MVIDAIKGLIHAVPFGPYVIKLNSGTIHHVPHPDFILMGPKRDWIVVSDEEGRPHWISSLILEEVIPLASASGA